MQSKRIIDHILLKFKNEFGIIPIIGLEVEFYSNPASAASAQSERISANPISDIILPQNIRLIKEKGEHQYEIIFDCTYDIKFLISEFENLKQRLKNEYNADFSPKPYLEDFGSGLHLHINFEDVFTKENFFNNKDNLEFAVNGLCNAMMETFLIFAPSEDSYLRYDKNYMSPTHICYGNNNRSAAVRIPDMRPRRLEHRIASSNTCIYLLLSTLLYSIYLGLKCKFKNHKCIYGNAYDEQYNLVPFPKTLNDSLVVFNENFFSNLLL